MGTHIDPRLLYDIKPASLPIVTFGILNPINQAFSYIQGKNRTLGNWKNTQSLFVVTSDFHELCICKKKKKEKDNMEFLVCLSVYAPYRDALLTAKMKIR